MLKTKRIMTEQEIFNKIKFFIEKFSQGIYLSPAEIVTLYLIYVYREESEEKDFISQELLYNAIEKSFYFLSKFNTTLPEKPNTVLENLLKKGFVLYSATERNSYYLSELSISIINGIFVRDVETITDVESNLYTIYTMLVGLENEDVSKVEAFFKHTFFDLVLKIDKKIRQLKEDIIDSKKEIKVSIRSGKEDSFKYFLNGLEKIREKLNEISTSLSRYSVYNQILFQMNKLEKKYENNEKVAEGIYRAYRKLFVIKNELENTLADVTEFINRHVALITSQVNISSLDKVLSFQNKLLQFFSIKSIYLRKPARLKVTDFRYTWKSQKRKPVIIKTENRVIKEKFDDTEQKEINQIVEYLLTALKEKGSLNFIEEILNFQIVKRDLPRFYNKILFKISHLVEIELLNKEFHFKNFYLSDIFLKPVSRIKKQAKNAS